MAVATDMAPNPKPSGDVEALEAVERLCSVPPPRFLSPSSELSRLAREASAHLFNCLRPFCSKSLPLDRLLTDEDFDAEQIWHQIELQSRPLVSALRRDVRRLEKMRLEELVGVEFVHDEGKEKEEEKAVGEEENEDDDDDDDDDEDNDDIEEDEDNIEKDGEFGEEGGEAERDGGGNDLEHSEQSEEEEMNDEGSEEVGEEDYDEDEYLIENELYPVGNEPKNEDSDDDIFARYEDFYGNTNKKPSQPRDRKRYHSSEESDSDDRESKSPYGSDADVQNTYTDKELDDQNNEELSTYERQRKELQSKIQQMEEENLGLKSWTMIGEVTASKRPKNSALEVDLDFEHNKGRPPITAEETTVNIEDIILKRIREGHLDEVQRAPKLPTKAPKELKELDDTKSKKGLGEIYEEEYSQKAGLAAAPLSVSDEQKKEANFLFKKLCLKLDALSHFHFAPKPVIEDMSIQANVPALAMEEIAPLAVSDAAMLAPEEIFTGKGVFKEEKELTQADRKRRRAKKKRKFKAEAAQRAVKRAKGNESINAKRTGEE